MTKKLEKIKTALKDSKVAYNISSFKNVITFLSSCKVDGEIKEVKVSIILDDINGDKVNTSLTSKGYRSQDLFEVKKIFKDFVYSLNIKGGELYV